MEKNAIIFFTSASKRPFSKNGILLACVSFLFLTTFFLLANDSHATLYSRRHDLPLTNKDRGQDANHSNRVTVANVSCGRLTIDHGCYQIVQDQPPQFMLKKSSELRLLNCSKRAPSTIVIGTKKSGTTTLKNFLSYHPDVAFAEKELKFINNHNLVTLDEYSSLMPYSTPQQVTMEKTPGYFIRLVVAKRLKIAIPDVKFIVIIRDPVNRAISDFVHMRYVDVTSVDGAKLLHIKPKYGNKIRYEAFETFRESVLFQNGTVKDYNSLVDSGIYVKYFRQWLQYFPLDRFLILDGEEFVKDPTPTMHRVESFLGIRQFFTEDHFYFDEQKHFYCLKEPLNTCMAKGKGRPHPQVDDYVINKLSEFYRPYNMELENLLNRTFPWS
ncbi:heparan sulfate glucosamine 3-O-sulfotransferase 1 [Strongylocentrotus purpuratus]|uniref:Sulfotransferase domain-containing protein n=1 Tax=Strongylocentrotus purpuratus TaxID=7668 RepID=A0A7M7GFU8_STRPU|nr:heparan sulfate glucosamine 3-O-sulfotransferase 1 [Strongylocentrotus purpuratus]|eukprot:XP_003724548.1 PREDICTED: heparan sulfate glucosamine 3-O-sulfotransferase 1-like [Strongylocentrotus purpuratus]